MERKPDLADLVIHSGVKGMKWDESKKKHNQEIAAENAKIQAMRNNQAESQRKEIQKALGGSSHAPSFWEKLMNGGDSGWHANSKPSPSAMQKIEGVFKKYAKMTLKSIFGKSDAQKAEEARRKKILNGPMYQPMVRDNQVVMDKKGNIKMVSSSDWRKGTQYSNTIIKTKK